MQKLEKEGKKQARMGIKFRKNENLCKSRVCRKISSEIVQYAHGVRANGWGGMVSGVRKRDDLFVKKVN